VRNPHLSLSATDLLPLLDLTVGLPGSKPPQIEPPQPPAKTETTAAALQLLQPKASHSSTAATRKEPSNPSISPTEPAAAPSTHAAAADTVRPSSPQLPSSAHLAGEHTLSPSPMSSDGVAANALDVSVTERPTIASNDDEVQSDASDSDTTPHEHDDDQEQHQEERNDAVAVTAVPVQPAGTFNSVATSRCVFIQFTQTFQVSRSNCRPRIPRARMR
jgi:hypothetical protein